GNETFLIWIIIYTACAFLGAFITKRFQVVS
ncbi:DUF2651 domain-containing protein, partial [Salmonella enterica subsp. enterica serovar Dublin]|nr:DUF2651 domain-containing protein [Salmonella enterica subsp. enterica serovar Dublin]